MTDLSHLEPWFSEDRLAPYHAATKCWYAAIEPTVTPQTHKDIREAIRRGTRNERAETRVVWLLS